MLPNETIDTVFHATALSNAQPVGPDSHARRIAGRGGDHRGRHIGPALAGRAERPARKSVWFSARNNLKQLGLALHSYHETHDRFPYSSTNSGIAAPTPAHTWNEFLFPYMDMGAVYLKIDFPKSQHGSHQRQSFREPQAPPGSPVRATNGPTKWALPLTAAHILIRGRWGRRANSTPRPRVLRSARGAHRRTNVRRWGLGPGSYCCHGGNPLGQCGTCRQPGNVRRSQRLLLDAQRCDRRRQLHLPAGRTPAELRRLQCGLHFSINFPGRRRSAKLNSSC